MRQLLLATAAGAPHRALERRVIPTGDPGLRLRFYAGVPRDVRRALKDFARWLRGRVGFEHPVQVTVVPHATVMGDHGAAGWALFVIPPADYLRGDVVRIYLGGGAAEILERHFRFSRREALEALVLHLAHEIKHYEQWRDGLAITERNVNRRAAALLTRYLKVRRSFTTAVAARAA